MARKRMISPEIWESQDFSALSDIAKIVFISLFSHADDEGRGRADPTFIKNITFPYDENRRVADIKTALSEIARRMSVQFYSVNGIEYYFMTNWERWQKVEKPSKSKFPPPPLVGEGGDIHSNGKFGECSGNSRGVIGETSPTNRIEKNRKESNNTSTGAGARKEEPEEFETKLDAFCEKYGIVKDSCSSYIAEMDFDLLDKAYAESKTYLQDKYGHPYAQSLDWIVRNYQGIIGGKKFKDRQGKSAGTAKQTQNRQTHDILESVYEHYKTEEEDGTE